MVFQISIKDLIITYMVGVQMKWSLSQLGEK